MEKELLYLTSTLLGGIIFGFTVGYSLAHYTWKTHYKLLMRERDELKQAIEILRNKK